MGRRGQEAAVACVGDSGRREDDDARDGDGNRCAAHAGWHRISVETRTRVDLPAHVTEPFAVFVNGVEQVRGRDFDVVGSALVFDRTLEHEGRLGFWRWLSLFLGVAGTYRKHDTVDVVYTHEGRRAVASLEPKTPGTARS
jgi:hypothetical protein